MTSQDIVGSRPDAASGAGEQGLEHWCAPEPPTPVRNVLTIDLEDWPIAVLGPRHRITSRVVENTRRCLHILRWHHVRATFFVLTKVAEDFPDLIREVHAAGHEIASHGHGHELLTNMTPRQFEADVKRSVDILTELVGQRPIGYRAPAFSIVSSTRWAGPILAGLGFKYDSSIFPIRHRRYGIPDAPRHIHHWRDCRLIECPPATFRMMGWNWPVAGGGYFRLLPGPLARLAIWRINRERMPAILYLHPYELDTYGILAHKRSGIRVNPSRHLTQALFRSQMERRLHRLLERFTFVTMRELLQHAV
ncbi:MAG: polysaccharide deacetylase family protein [Phycisphaerales bacterium]|nr:polysaccharide deacetylase family protein [Phycisphaerales bacterium]